MSSSVLQNVIHPRPTGSGPLTESAEPDEFKSQGVDDMERVLAVLVENAPVAMAMFDHQMHYLLANRAWVEEFGLGGVSGLVGRSQFDVFPNLHPGWRQVYERALQGHIIRSEHDALAGSDGKRIIYRWEVRPWRRQMDASVGGLMITCERFGQSTTAPSLETDDEPASKAAGPAAPPSSSFGNLAVPTLTLDEKGVIRQANAAACNVCLARGLKEGETEFWDAFGDTPTAGLLKQQLLGTLESLSDGSQPPSVILSVPPPSVATHPGNTSWNMAAALETSTTPRPTRWLLTRNAGQEGPGPVYTALGLPPEPSSRVPVTPPNLPAIASAVAAITQPAQGESVGTSLELRRLQDDLARAKQELRTLHEAERTFTQREGRLKHYLDSLPFGVLVLNDLGEPLFQNQPLTRLLGRPIQKEETVEQWLAAACPNEHHCNHVTTLWREDVWRRQLTRTFSLATADGLLKDLEFQPASLAGGGLLVSIQDATEKVRHEEQLRATEAKFRALLQEAPLPVVLIDKAGSVFEVNHNAEELFGCPKTELRRLPLDHWLDAESATARHEAIRDLQLRSQRSTMIDVRVIREDYDPIPVHLHLAQVMDTEGEPHCTIHFFELEPPPQIVEVPVPVREEAPTQPQAGPSELMGGITRRVARQVPKLELLFKTNVNGRIKACTERGLERLHLTEEEALGRPLHQHFRPSDATGFYADLTEYAQDPKVIHDLTCYAQGGAKYPIKAQIESLGGGGFDFALHEIGETTVYDEVTEPAAAFTSSPAATHTYPQAPALPALGGENHFLEAAAPAVQVLQAPPSLPGGGPLPAVNLAREKLLLSETHHRIKNHLQIISSLLNLESNTVSDPTARNALRSSQNRVRSIADLHQHLYQVALGTSDSFIEFAEGLLSRLRECYDLPAERVPVHLELETGSIQQEWLMPLALTLNETLSNCFEHAFPDERSGEVFVSLKYSGDTGELIVTDNGIGLSESLRPGTGTGLGLKILAVFAEQMRGQLLLARPEQGGTEIRLRFPLIAEN